MSPPPNVHLALFNARNQENRRHNDLCYLKMNSTILKGPAAVRLLLAGVLRTRPLELYADSTGVLNERACAHFT